MYIRRTGTDICNCSLLSHRTLARPPKSDSLADLPLSDAVKVWMHCRRCPHGGEFV